MKYALLLVLIPLTALSQTFGTYDIPEEELDPGTEDILIRKPEKYLRNEAMIYDFNTDLGIKDQRKYTGEDRNRLSFAAHISGDYEHFSDMFGAEFAYMRRSERYHRAWYGFQFFRHKTYFDNVTQNHSTGNNSNSDAAFQRPNNQDNTITALGFGAGYRFKLLLNFWETQDWFENVDVFLNYVTMDETFINRTYKGYGLTTNYGLHKRSSTNYFYGGKISYNISAVTRDALGTESKDERTLALGWLSLAFELGFYY